MGKYLLSEIPLLKMHSYSEVWGKNVSLYQKRVRYNKFAEVFEKVLPHSSGRAFGSDPLSLLREIIGDHES